MLDRPDYGTASLDLRDVEVQRQDEFATLFANLCAKANFFRIKRSLYYLRGPSSRSAVWLQPELRAAEMNKFRQDYLRFKVLEEAVNMGDPGARPFLDEASLRWHVSSSW